jgi:hypothetical protein
MDKTLFLVLTLALAGVACVEEPPALDATSADDPSSESTTPSLSVFEQRSRPSEVPSRSAARTSPESVQPAPAPAPRELGPPSEEDDGYKPFGDGFQDFGDGFRPSHPSTEGSSFYWQPAGNTTHRVEPTLVSLHSAVTTRSS